jgi:hypothetical protein
MSLLVTTFSDGRVYSRAVEGRPPITMRRLRTLLVEWPIAGAIGGTVSQPALQSGDVD